MHHSIFENIQGTNIESASYDTDAQSWLIKFSNGDSLNIECMWRLLEEDFICSTSEDHEQYFGREKPFNGEAALNEMSAHKIMSISCTPKTGDINIKLGELFILQIIPVSAGYESWHYKQKNGGSYVAVAGQIHSY